MALPQVQPLPQQTNNSTQVAPKITGFTQLQLNGIDRRLYRPLVDGDVDKIGTDNENIYANALDNGIDSSQISDLGIPVQKLLPAFNNVIQADLTLNIGHTLLSCDTSSNAITLTLPNAANTLGHQFIVLLRVDGGHDVTLNTDGTDTYVGDSSATGTHITFNDAGDFAFLTAAGPDTWLVIRSVGVVYS